MFKRAPLKVAHRVPRFPCLNYFRFSEYLAWSLWRRSG